jgi:hypothetical protein
MAKCPEGLEPVQVPGYVLVGDRYTCRKPCGPYWRRDWNGQCTSSVLEPLFLIVALLLLAVLQGGFSLSSADE